MYLEKKAFPIHSLSLTDSFVNENAKEALALRILLLLLLLLLLES